MARPRKLSDDDMLQIVDAFYEATGDSSRLKCSFLEEYAISQGIEVKAYDFRRNMAVRARMEELKALGTTGNVAIAYKNLDVDAFINKARNRDDLRNSLLELDRSWGRIYDKAEELSTKNMVLLSENLAQKKAFERLGVEKEDVSAQLKDSERAANTLLLENRYLKKMLRQYLYPAIANEILKDESVLSQVETEVTAAAMDMMTEPEIPLSFSQAIAADKKMISREDALLARLKQQMNGD